MSKQIRIEDHVYDKLEAFRDKRETFSEAVERLLAAGAEFNRLADILEGAARFRESQRDRSLPDAVGKDLEGKPLIERSQR